MKALEIAKKIDEYVRDYGCSNGTINLLDDLIDELESLENRSCENCVYYLSDNGNYPLEPCGECSRWYSDRWESK